MSGNLKIEGSYIGLYGLDDQNLSFPMIRYAGTDLWVGANNPPHSGHTVISAGYDHTNNKGYESPRVCILTSNSSSGAKYYDLYHKGNLTTASTATAGLVKLDSTATKYLSGDGWKYPVTFSRLQVNKDNISIAANTSQAFSITYTVPTGLTVLGVVGCLIRNATSSGSGSSLANVTYVNAPSSSAGTASITLRNLYTSAIKIRVTIIVLGYKIN